MRHAIIGRSFTVLAAAALSLAGLAGLAPASAGTGARSGPDSTIACGTGCFDLYSLLLGPTQIQQTVPGGVTLLPGPASLPNAAGGVGDFGNVQVATLGTACGVPGEIPKNAYVCIHFAASLPVFEWVWAPFGNQTGLCVGAAKALAGQRVILVPCNGSPSNTFLWVYDSARGLPAGASCLVNGWCPWYNGGSTAGNPVVLRVNGLGGQLFLAAAGPGVPAGIRKQFCIGAPPYTATPTC